MTAPDKAQPELTQERARELFDAYVASGQALRQARDDYEQGGGTLALWRKWREAIGAYNDDQMFLKEAAPDLARHYLTAEATLTLALARAEAAEGALRNVKAMANREIHRAGAGKKLSVDQWWHVKRFCEEGGVRDSYLRAGAFEALRAAVPADLDLITPHLEERPGLRATLASAGAGAEQQQGNEEGIDV